MVDLSLNNLKDWGNPIRMLFSNAYKSQDMFINIDEVIRQFSKLREEYQQKPQEVPEYRSVLYFDSLSSDSIDFIFFQQMSYFKKK